MVTVGLTPAEVKELVAHARLAFNERRRVSR
jgi:hypothetical protein